MQFQVPQFVEVEDKIFGPFTFKQFIYLLGTAGICFIIYKLIPYFYLAVIFMAPVAIFGLALAFYKVNDRPFIETIEAALRFYGSSKLYIWQPRVKTPKTEIKTDSTKGQNKNYGALSSGPRLTSNKLSDLAWSLDVKENKK